MPDATVFNPVWEYGVSIGVIICCFFVIYKGITIGLDRFDMISKDHNGTIQKLFEGHKSERKEWRDEASQREDKITSLLTKVINERDS